MALFVKYSYPGNIRELANYVERIAIMSESEIIDSADIEGLLPHLVGEGPRGTLKIASEQFERGYIKKTITGAGGNMTRAADILGLERSHLYKKMKALGMEQKGKRGDINDQ
jgi:DNA-binding NtrC family response regulator